MKAAKQIYLGSTRLAVNLTAPLARICWKSQQPLLCFSQKFGLHPVFDRPMANKGWMSTAWLEPCCQCTKESSDSMWPRVAVANVEHHRASVAGTVT